MKKPTRRPSILVTLLLALTGVAVPLVVVPQAEAQSSPGRYRSQGQSRAKSPVRVQQRQPYIDRNLYGSPWNPSYYHQNKFFQVTPDSQGQAPFTGNPSHSQLHHRGGLFYNIGVPISVLPGYGFYDYGQESSSPAPAPPPAPAPAPQIIVVQPAPAAPAQTEVYEPPPPPPPAAPVSTEPGKLALTVHPADSRILVNDRFVGTGESLAAKGEPLVLKPGVYVLEAEHSTYTAQRLVFSVIPEQTVHVIIDLTSDRPGRRARVETGKGDGFLLN